MDSGGLQGVDLQICPGGAQDLHIAGSSGPQGGRVSPYVGDGKDVVGGDGGSDCVLIQPAHDVQFEPLEAAARQRLAAGQDALDLVECRC